MNNEHRDNPEELKLADETLRVLDGEQCESDQDSRTLELGRLLKQSASHELPESNDTLRSQLLAELDAEDAAPMDPSKTLAPKKSVDRIRRRRMWMAMPAAGLLIAVGGVWLYSAVTLRVAEHDSKTELAELEARAEAAELQFVREKAPIKGEALQSFADVDQAPANFEYTDTDVLVAKSQSGAINIGGAYNADTGTLPSEPLSTTTTTNTVVPVPDGVTIKLPKLATTSTNTVVNVPDGGTIIMGGTKQKLGGEREFGLVVQESEQLGESQQQQGKGQQQQGDEQVQQGEQAAGQGPGQGRRFAFFRHIDALSRSAGQVSGDDAIKPPARGRARGLGRYQPKEVRYQPQIGQDTFGVDLAESNDEYFEDKTESLSKRFKSNSREQYTPIYENQFVNAVGGAAVSTFSVDVDTASYANVRRFLNSGQMPPRDSVRIEELVNYFQYDYPQPKGDDPFSVNMELATCPWNDTHKLLRVGLKGKEVHVKERPATNVVYLIDVSGSMNSPDKLPLLKRGFQMMTRQLGENDRVSIVTYAGNAGVALEPTTGNKTKTINEAIERLSPGGSTHGSAGIELAYKLAQQHFITGGVNKVILATDGDLNVGVTDDDSLVKLIKQKASEGVFLTVLGFGTGNLQDGKLEKLADNGNGHYAYLDSNREAHRVLVQQLSGSLVTIAKDVKLQIEFNPAEVKSYRLIGYENRMLATKDFDDDRKDAGEIGAGHTVTAIYEIQPAGGAAVAFTAPAGMKYQAAEETPEKSMVKMMKNLTGAAASGELATLALRYKKPDENESKRIEFAVKNDDKSFTSASDDFRFAASVAGFGMLLRGSEHVGTSTPAMVLEMATESTGDDASGYRAEFLDLVRKICK